MSVKSCAILCNWSCCKGHASAESMSELHFAFKRVCHKAHAMHAAARPVRGHWTFVLKLLQEGQSQPHVGHVHNKHICRKESIQGCKFKCMPVHRWREVGGADSGAYWRSDSRRADRGPGGIAVPEGGQAAA